MLLLMFTSTFGTMASLIGNVRKGSGKKRRPGSGPKFYLSVRIVMLNLRLQWSKQVHFAPKLVLESPAKKSVPAVPWVPSLYFGAFRTSVDFSDAHSFSSFTVLPPDDAPAELSSSSSPATLRSALKKMACSDDVHSSPPLADAPLPRSDIMAAKF